MSLVLGHVPGLLFLVLGHVPGRGTCVCPLCGMMLLTEGSFQLQQQQNKWTILCSAEMRQMGTLEPDLKVLGKIQAFVLLPQLVTPGIALKFNFSVA